MVQRPLVQVLGEQPMLLPVATLGGAGPISTKHEPQSFRAIHETAACGHEALNCSSCLVVNAKPVQLGKAIGMSLAADNEVTAATANADSSTCRYFQFCAAFYLCHQFPVGRHPGAAVRALKKT